MAEIKLLVIVFSVLLTISSTVDPCQESDYKILREEVQRSANYTILPSDTTIEDSRLPTGWYRIYSVSGNDMVNYSVPMFHCGTMYPLWMNGTLPSVADQTVTRKVCRSGLNDTCEHQYDIEVRNCGNYRTYYLRQLNVDKSAYCFGTLPVPSTTTVTTTPRQTRLTYPQPQPTGGHPDDSDGDHDKNNGNLDSRREWMVLIIVILLAVMCAAVLIGPIIWCCMKRKSRKGAVYGTDDNFVERNPQQPDKTKSMDNAVYYVNNKSDIGQQPPPYTFVHSGMNPYMFESPDRYYVQ